MDRTLSLSYLLITVWLIITNEEARHSTQHTLHPPPPWVQATAIILRQASISPWFELFACLQVTATGERIFRTDTEIGRLVGVVRGMLALVDSAAALRALEPDSPGGSSGSIGTPVQVGMQALSIGTMLLCHSH